MKSSRIGTMTIWVDHLPPKYPVIDKKNYCSKLTTLSIKNSRLKKPPSTPFLWIPSPGRG